MRLHRSELRRRQLRRRRAVAATAVLALLVAGGAGISSLTGGDSPARALSAGGSQRGGGGGSQPAAGTGASTPAPPPKATGTVTISAVGDTMLGYGSTLAPNPGSYFDAVRSQITGDIRFANLEGTLADRSPASAPC